MRSARAPTGENGELVAEALRRNLPGPEVLTPEQRLGRPDRFESHRLHIEPDGSFSIIALVWRPGQVTRIHDHLTWCVFGVIQGVEYEELFDEDRQPDRRERERDRRRQRLRAARRHPSGPQRR